MDFSTLWDGLVFPLLRLVSGLACGLLVANLLEVLQWTHGLSQLALPLARAAHMGEYAAASFSLSFLSAASANALLGERYAAGCLSRRELMLANLFNALPAYLLHTPTIFLLTWPVLGWPAYIYVGLTLLAATLRTVGTFFLARCLLPEGGDNTELAARDNLFSTVDKQHEACTPALPKTRKETCVQALLKAWTRFLRRLPRLIFVTVPIYIAMYCLHQWGVFATAQNWMAVHAHWLAFLKPEAMGIIVLHLAAELGAALGAAGSALQANGLAASDVVLALLTGNIISTPMRALRHQLPAYAAYYPPRTALFLIVSNQSLRAASLIVMTLLYWWLVC